LLTVNSCSETFSPALKGEVSNQKVYQFIFTDVTLNHSSVLAPLSVEERKTNIQFAQQLCNSNLKVRIYW